MIRSWFVFFCLLSLIACSTLNPTRVPTVTLNVNPTQGQAPLTITASAQASDPDGDSLSYTWYVNDERIAASNRLDYTVTEAGNVLVSVSVSDGNASARAQQMIVITAADTSTPLDASFTVTREQDLAVTFNAAYPPTNNVTYTWNFGDGSTFSARGISGASVNHTYTNAGIYEVQLELSQQSNRTQSSQTIDLTAIPDPPRPNDAPDVVIIGFAGRCGVNDPFYSCDAPRANRPYLDALPQPSTLQALQSNLEQQGYSVTIRSFVGRLSAAEASTSAPAPEGYLEAEAYINEVYNTWIRNQANPTRLIAVGHSHGAVWMNLLLLNQPDIPFDYAISLDGVCSFWWADHEPAISAHYGSQGRPRPLAQGDPCNSFALPGLGSLRDLDDVIPTNVGVNLEVQASPVTIPFDDQINFRLDGSRRDIFTYVAKQTHSGNTGVQQANGEAMRWVNAQINQYGFASP